MNRERAERRERIAVTMVASMCVNPDESWERMITAAMTGAEMLMAKLDEAAANDPVCSRLESESKLVADLERKLASNVLRRGELMDSCRLKDEQLDELRLENTSLNQTVATLDRQIGELNAELSRLRESEGKLAAFTQFAGLVRNVADDEPQLYSQFVRLVRDLEAKVGAA